VTDILLQIGANFDGADKVNEQLNKLDRSLDENIKAVNKFDQEFRRLERAKKKNTVTTQGYNAALQQSVTRLLDTSTSTDRHTQSMERNTATMQRGQRVTLQTGSAQQVLRQRFLETANSIAVLDGPLGGVASRFSSFGVLVGRTGVLLAGVLTGFAALGFVVRQGIRDFSEYETSMARISSVLELTGNRAGLTSSQIRGLSESIALNSLQSSQAVREASAQLLTFGNIAGGTFKEVLTLASDMAALGFGTLQSESLKLAKAIEDPRQSLASLSRSGITFTRQQRSVILSLIETGRAGEATARILEAVRNQVGGAAAREAETFAGSLDTIVQAYGVMFRTLGQGVAGEGRLFREFIDEAARLSAIIVESATPFTDPEDIRRGVEELEQLKNIIDVNKQSIEDLQDLIQSGEIAPDIGLGAILFLRDATSDAEKRIASLTDKIGDGLVGGLSASQIAANNLSEAMSEVESSIRSAILDTGLTSLESYVQSAIRAANATAAVEENVDGLGDAFIRTKTIEFLVKEAQSLENNIRRATDAFYDSNSAAQAQLEFVGQTGREAAVLQSIRENQLRVEAEILRLEEQKSGASEELISKINRQQQGLRDNLATYESTAEAARDLAAQTDRITEERRKLDQATGFLENLEQENLLLATQLGFMDQGVEAAEARRLAEVEVEKQLLRQEQALLILQSALGDLNDLEAERLGLINAQLAAIETREVQRAEVAARSRSGGSSRGGGGPSGPDAVEKLRQQLDREVQLLQVFGQQRLEMEARFRVYDAMTQAGITLSEQQQQALVDQIMLTHQLKQAEEDRIETQRKLEQAQQRAADRMTNLFMAATQGGDAFKQTLGNIIQELARMAAMRAFQSIIGGSSGSVLTSIFGFANGGVFQGGRVKAFAKGGVVDSPTMFPMKGATGLMGEAGPEAIIPLKRGRDGSLGVQGGMTNAVSVTYAPQISVKGSGEEVAALRQEIARMNAEAPARIISTIQKAQKKRVL
jgi:hypothetical protein